ncbi:probable 2-oxoglutarate-dependent dioxygenase AOP1 [Humulus lupulus]|uniref:probable 2-oxoglutarate-dependent dioxygenase AOP1 n=1 Tax=Humulus lupulus TaxID=3486 RepID=UPI002B416C10|nr:probable 2-oxoglutarate-dependent dioxygenase AOP1 [Humulus lupulus]
MATETAVRVPIIDFSVEPLKPGTPEWNTVRTQVRQALEEFGCFEAQFDQIPIDIRKALFDALHELFDFPLQSKLQNISKNPYHGYLGQYPTLPLYESMGIDEANILEKVECFTSILWPKGNPTFCKTIQSYSDQLSELDQIIRRMILESLGVEKYLEEHMESTYYHLRMMNYKSPQTTETKLGLKAHTDKNIVTILYQNQVDGLEIQTKDGEWISVKPSSLDSFVVMIGDVLCAWANGRLHAPNHRVMMTGNEARYSTGLFSIPNAGCIVTAPEELVDEDHPLLFKPFDYAEFLYYYQSQSAQKAPSDLRSYCGV